MYLPSILIINDKREALNFVITQVNIDDREPLNNPKFVIKIKGKLYADKGYIGQIEHSNHRSFNGFIVNTIAAFITYSFFSKKSLIKFEEVITNQVALF